MEIGLDVRGRCVIGTRMGCQVSSRRVTNWKGDWIAIENKRRIQGPLILDAIILANPMRGELHSCLSPIPFALPMPRHS